MPRSPSTDATTFARTRFLSRYPRARPAKRVASSVSVTSGEVGRIAGVSGDTVKVVQNLPGVARAPGGFGMLVVRGGDPADTRVYVDGMEVPLVFHFGGITSVIWANGYSFDYSLVRLPIFDDDGYPVQRRGVTAYPGLYFVGLSWLHKFKSPLLFGVGEDAAHIVSEIAARKPVTHVG